MAKDPKDVGAGWNSSKAVEQKPKETQKEQKPTKKCTTKFSVPFQRHAERHQQAQDWFKTLNNISEEKSPKQIFAEKLTDLKDVGNGWGVRPKAARQPKAVVHSKPEVSTPKESAEKNPPRATKLPFQRSAKRHQKAQDWFNRLNDIKPGKTPRQEYAEKLAKDPRDLGPGWGIRQPTAKPEATKQVEKPNRQAEKTPRQTVAEKQRRDPKDVGPGWGWGNRQVAKPEARKAKNIDLSAERARKGATKNKADSLLELILLYETDSQRLTDEFQQLMDDLNKKVGGVIETLREKPPEAHRHITGEIARQTDFRPPSVPLPPIGPTSEGKPKILFNDNRHLTPKTPPELSPRGIFSFGWICSNAGLFLS